MLRIEGFLSSEIIISLQHMRDCIGEPPSDKKSDLELECLGYDFNKLAMRAAQLSYPLNLPSDFLAGLLFVRLIQDYQAVILMAGRGMRAQSRTMVRTTLESMFHCLAASENIQLKAGRTFPINYVDAILSAHDSYRIKQSIHVLKSEFLSDDVKMEVKRAIEEAKTNRPVGINLQNLAEDLGRSDWYSGYYRRLSQDSHPSVTAIEQHILTDDSSGEAIARFGQDYDEFGGTLSIAILVLFEALRSIMNKQMPEEMAEKLSEDAFPLLERLAKHIESAE